MSDAVNNRRRSARVMSREAQSAEKNLDQALTKKRTELPKKNVKRTQKNGEVPKRKETLAQRILRENNNLLGDSGSDRHTATTTGDDETMEEDSDVFTEDEEDNEDRQASDELSSESDEDYNSFAEFAFARRSSQTSSRRQPSSAKAAAFDTSRFTTSLASSMRPAAGALDTIKETKEDDSDFSDDNDEWVEMERIDEAAMDDRAKASVHVIIKAPPAKKTKEQLEAERWMNEIRLEIARRRRALYLDMHRMHILGFIAHLRFHVGAVIQAQAALADSLAGILPADVLAFCPTAMDKAVQAFRALFRLCSAAEARAMFVGALQGGPAAQKTKKSKVKLKRNAKATPSDTAVAVEVDQFVHVRTADHYGRYLASLIAQKRFTSNLDLSVVEPKKTDEKENIVDNIDQKPTTSTAAALSTTKARTRSASASTAASGSPSKPLMAAAKRDAQTLTSKRRASVGGDITATAAKNRPKRCSVVTIVSASESPQKKPRATASSSFSGLESDDLNQLTPRNYWVEFYDDVERRWICVDPSFAVVDRPKKIEKHASQPMLYVFVMDNEMGIREVSAKYSSDFMTTKHRRLRIEQEWLDKTLQLPPLKANRVRAVAEDAQIRGIMLDRDRPSTVAEYKNHPLYVLEKDLLKFEAIYPPDMEPLGEIRGHKIFPRSAVFTLQGELNWIKLARNIKAGEKPYKVVKARPNFHIPKEERTQLYLDVYGYWQTEPYVPPPVIDGKIPRNNYGNVYLYQKSMIPKGCVHLKLNGLMQVARRMDLEAVPAVTGWEFSGGGNHPLIEGCVVLKKDANVLRKAWEEFTAKKAEREAKRAKERVWNNWKKLIKGKLLLEKMRTRFA